MLCLGLMLPRFGGRGTIPVLVLLVASSACSGAAPGAEGDEAHLETATKYPAFAYTLPQLVSAGGPTLPTPTFTAITFDGDPMRDEIEEFTRRIAASEYWKAVGADYGIGPAATGSPLHVAEAPPDTLTDGDVANWLAARLGDGAAFGPPDPSTIYGIYYPAGTRITRGADTSCSEFGAFHNSVTLDSVPVPVTFMVIPRCDSFASAAGSSIGGRAFVTFAASHELLEAATDPKATIDPAYNGVDDGHLIWGDVFAAEVGDLCAQGQRWDVLPPTDVGFSVQRMWSNTAAKAGHDPCIPGISNVYFNAVPVLTETLHDGAGAATESPSDEPHDDTPPPNAANGSRSMVTLARGTTKTIEVRLSSSGLTSGPWSIRAIDWDNRKENGPENLTFSFDAASGKNGDVLHLSITAKTSGDHAFVLVSTLGSQSTYWPGLVVVP